MQYSHFWPFSFQGKETVQFRDDCFSPVSLEEPFNQAAPNKVISVEDNKAEAGFLPSPPFCVTCVSAMVPTFTWPCVTAFCFNFLPYSLMAETGPSTYHGAWLLITAPMSITGTEECSVTHPNLRCAPHQILPNCSCLTSSRREESLRAGTMSYPLTPPALPQQMWSEGTPQRSTLCRYMWGGEGQIA